MHPSILVVICTRSWEMPRSGARHEGRATASQRHPIPRTCGVVVNLKTQSHQAQGAPPATERPWGGADHNPEVNGRRDTQSLAPSVPAKVDDDTNLNPNTQPTAGQGAARSARAVTFIEYIDMVIKRNV